MLEETRQPRFLPAIQTVDPGFLRGISRGIAGSTSDGLFNHPETILSPLVRPMIVGLVAMSNSRCVSTLKCVADRASREIQPS